MMATLTGAKSVPHFSITKQSEQSKLDLDNFIESLNEFKAMDTSFVLPYKLDQVHICSVNDICCKTFSKSFKNWNTRIEE